MTRTLLLVALTGLVAPAPTPAQELHVCVRDMAELKKPAQHQLVAELEQLFPRVDLAVGLNPCEVVAGTDTVRILVLADARDAPADALGRALYREGRILPLLEVFADAVARFTGTRDLERFGRALGRVAAHELGHFVRQNSAHQEKGPMRATLEPSELIAEDRAPFLDLTALD